MTSHNGTHYDGSTALDPDEAEGLRPGLATWEELNEFEQANIAQGFIWARNSRKLKKNLLSIDSLKLLHRRMFDDTWRWAGTFRTTGKNIGAEPYLMQTLLSQLCGDGTYWLENNTYPIGVSAIRFHHRLVSIHPFPNGNGRHSRMTADLLMIFTGQAPFTWGGKSIDVEGETRNSYLAALRAADLGDYSLLLEFANHF
ncbi:mobile mystery protein B [soil metagenome]